MTDQGEAPKVRAVAKKLKSQISYGGYLLYGDIPQDT